MRRNRGFSCLGAIVGLVVICLPMLLFELYGRYRRGEPYHPKKSRHHRTTTQTAPPARKVALKTIDVNDTEVINVVMVTNIGPVKLDIYPEAAPKAAERFLELVDVGFYDNTAVFHTVRGNKQAYVRFGINPRFREWENRTFPADPQGKYYQREGTLAFINSGGVNSSTQLFINSDNHTPKNQRKAIPFGRVTEGMVVVKRFKYMGFPDGPPVDEIWNDVDYFNKANQQPTIIRSIRRL